MVLIFARRDSIHKKKLLDIWVNMNMLLGYYSSLALKKLLRLSPKQSDIAYKEFPVRLYYFPHRDEHCTEDEPQLHCKHQLPEDVSKPIIAILLNIRYTINKQLLYLKNVDSSFEFH